MNKAYLVTEIRKWLGDDGLKFFRELKAKYGRVDAMYMEQGIPHLVHFREGMQVRNKLRNLTKHSWTAEQYDNYWVEIVEQAIVEDKIS